MNTNVNPNVRLYPQQMNKNFYANGFYDNNRLLNVPVKNRLRHANLFAKNILRESIPREARGFHENVGNRSGSVMTAVGSAVKNSKSEKQEDREYSARKFAVIAAVVLGAIGVYSLSEANKDIESTREKSRAIIDNIKIIVNNSSREHTRAKWNRVKAITLLGIAAVMGVGAVFGSMLAIQITGVIGVAFGLKCLYDLLRDKVGVANKKDAVWLKNTTKELENEDPKSRDIHLKAFADEPFWTNENYMTVTPPQATSFKNPTRVIPPKEQNIPQSFVQSSN